MQQYDVIVVGGGPAGLSAALVLGRCRRKVLVCDSGKPRNAAAMHMHGFLSRDGINPRELLRLAREEVACYGVEVLAAEVIDATCTRTEGGTRFEVTLADGRVMESRKMLLATGVVDLLPRIEGVSDFYGKSVHHCPYCDGWEHRDQALVAYGRGAKAAGLALNLTTWSDRVTACLDGGELEDEYTGTLKRNKIEIRTERVRRLEGEGGQLKRIIFESGPPLDCDALFFNTDQVQRSTLPLSMGCGYDDAGAVITTGKQGTRQRGLFLAGDADGDVQFVIVAAAEGATAGTAINRELQDEDLGMT